MTSTILVVDDDLQLRRFLRTTLAGHGYAVVEAGSVAEATAAIARVHPAVILLDLGLPDGDGLEVLRKVPADARPPVIVLSARGQEGDKVTALDVGADDYLTKPFGASELLARIRVVLRRVGGTPTPDVIEIGPIRIDQPRHSVSVEDREVHLTPIEFRLLLELARHPGRVLTHHQLLREIWGPNAVDELHYLRVHMGALRKKLEADPARPQWLLTEAGVGYRLREPPQPAEQRSR
ncbi:MAG TPA: response regulator [Kofleriaceae bacterium]|nr:response regulator [Kofleriaceae bacterium]